MKRKSIGEGAAPLVCTPLVGATEEALLAELAAVLPKAPDAIEWRADFFSALADPKVVVAMASKIEAAAPGCALIFTIRSRREGGQPTALSDIDAIEIDEAICRETGFGYVDCELSAGAESILSLRDVAHAHEAKIIASYHNFERTPEREFLVGKFLEAERLGLDVAKVAVMPKGMDDVLELLAATLEGKKLVALPLITMSMGGYGAISRLVGGAFGSSLSFAVGRNASAPGQVPIEDLKTALAIVERSRRAS
ncbi:MAG TPA: type I 3-dehydroquinate dehydratase [Rectinemataceae bacterium]|nr:type I 3-dehydroquinate dehydratase [Rectinemataceae bacterium]